jgi:hypothetical protein
MISDADVIHSSEACAVHWLRDLSMTKPRTSARRVAQLRALLEDRRPAVRGAMPGV